MKVPKDAIKSTIGHISASNIILISHIQLYKENKAWFIKPTHKTRILVFPPCTKCSQMMNLLSAIKFPHYLNTSDWDLLPIKSPIVCSNIDLQYTDMKFCGIGDVCEGKCLGELFRVKVQVIDICPIIEDYFILDYCNLCDKK